MAEYRYQINSIENGTVLTDIGGGQITARKHAAKPSILMVGMHLTKTRGGISTLTADILKSDLKNDFEITYIASQAEDHGLIGKFMLAVKAYMQFAVSCIFDRPGLVYVHMGSNASLYRESGFVLLGKLFRNRVILHFHAGDVDEYLPYQPKLGRRIIKLALASCDRIIAVSAGSARQIREFVSPEKMAVIPNAIDISAFEKMPERSKKVNGDEAVRLLFVGATGKLKGELDLIKALQLLKHHEPPLKASFLGYGAEDLDQTGIGHIVEHLGAVPLDERIGFYEKADIFVLPTYAEAMPISVIEAMAAGLAVITTPVGGIPEILDDGREGYLCPVGDHKTLAEKIAYLACNVEARLSMGRAARKRTVSKMDFGKYIDALRNELVPTAQIETKPMTTTSLFIKRSIKSAASIVPARIGSLRVGPGAINIIAYHRVVADITKAERESIYGTVISAATFRRHCEALKRAFDVVSLETAMHFLDERRKVARPLAVLTFDDGYLDFYEQAFPILNELGLPATVFLPTACIGESKPLAHDRIFWLLKQAGEKSVSVTDALRSAGVSTDTIDLSDCRGNLLKQTDKLVYLPHEIREKAITALEAALGDDRKDYPAEYRLLDWDMVREMSKKGINFGGHTSNHVVLPLESSDVIKNELETSKAVLEAQLGKKAASFAYPNGEYSPAIRQMTADAGYTVAVTTKKRVNRPGADLLALGRTSLCEESTRGITGAYSSRVADLRLGV
jgi:glycosyltransferase involved in cell wall biosynthesis/peptidoglycan/xylan/chitin deacetylase (PgdA/CDA1 family)